jgi:hypothetical protein
MTRCSAVCVRSSNRISAALVALILSAAVGAATEQRLTSPRLREHHLPARIPQASGGGEVVLELTVDPLGAVSRIERIRVTPPYAGLVLNSAAQWRFEPATVEIEGRARSISASVLVVAVFRPASFYAGPAPGVPPQEPAAPSPWLPRVESVVMPAYPPTAIGDRIVLVEIEMSGHAKPRAYRIVGPRSGFDTAALDAVRSWRFGAPTLDVPDPLFVYAMVGFRVPLVPVSPRRE